MYAWLIEIVKWLLRSAKDITEIGRNVASILAVVAAACWFLYTTQFKRRLQFDLDCRFVPLQQNPDRTVAELQFIFENKGFVEHKLWNLNVSVHALDAEDKLTAKEATREIQFWCRLLPEIQLVPKDYDYYFVRPGVRQIITHIIAVPSAISAIRVTSGFYYDRRKRYPHTARRVFQLPHARNHA
jgi:hypothetical protein